MVHRKFRPEHLLQVTPSGLAPARRRLGQNATNATQQGC